MLLGHHPANYLYAALYIDIICNQTRYCAVYYNNRFLQKSRNLKTAVAIVYQFFDTV